MIISAPKSTANLGARSHRDSWENHGRIMGEKMGKPWENLGKSWKNHETLGSNMI